jgi:hypothetical protein
MYDGTYWVWMNCGVLDGNSNTVPCIQIETAAATAAKAGTCTNYSLLAKSYAHANIRYSNTSKTALTLNVNGKGAKPIYINGTASSASNYTLPAGTYIIYYDGTNYHFRTDGVLPNLPTYDPHLLVTYEELKNLRDSGKLIPGQKYRITDYITTTSEVDTKSAEHQFDIIVTANDNKTLSEIASACVSKFDIQYFDSCNLSEWQIWYCLDNDTSRFSWADEENGTGVIYRMIDEWGNDCPYDFKNIKFLKPIISETDTQDPNYYYTFCYDGGSFIGDASRYGYGSGEYSRVFNNVIKQYLNINGQHLNRILFIGEECVWYNNTFGNNCSDNIFEDYCHGNTFGESCYGNTFGFQFYNNTFGDRCHGNLFIMSCGYNTFGNNCYENTFGEECFSNTFGDDCFSNGLIIDCDYNTFGNGCHDNIFTEYCHNNEFGNSCHDNSFSNDCCSNTFGIECFNNTFDSECNHNTFGNNCSNNSFGAECHSNTLGNYCNDIVFTYYCYENTFGHDCYTNRFGQDCNNNKFGNNCYNNTFGDEFDANSFENNCYNNEFSDDCYANSFGNRCCSNHFGTGYYFNSFGNACDNNTFGDNCYNNSFGNSCRKNTLGNDCNNNTLGEECEYIKFGNASSVQSYYRNIIIDNGNKYIYLYAIKTRSSNSYYQNVRIGLGVNNTTTYKTIADSNDSGQTYETWYRPSNSQTKNV